jgi:hypothetical protein
MVMTNWKYFKGPVTESKSTQAENCHVGPILVKMEVTRYTGAYNTIKLKNHTGKYENKFTSK